MLVTCTYFHYFRSGLFFCRILFQVIFLSYFSSCCHHVGPNIVSYCYFLWRHVSAHTPTLMYFVSLAVLHVDERCYVVLFFLLLHFGLLIVAFGLLITIFVKNRLSSAPHALPRRTSTYFTWSESGGVWWKREARQH